MSLSACHWLIQAFDQIWNTLFPNISRLVFFVIRKYNRIGIDASFTTSPIKHQNLLYQFEQLIQDESTFPTFHSHSASNSGDDNGSTRQWRLEQYRSFAQHSRNTSRSCVPRKDPCHIRRRRRPRNTTQISERLPLKRCHHKNRLDLQARTKHSSQTQRKDLDRIPQRPHKSPSPLRQSTKQIILPTPSLRSLSHPPSSRLRCTNLRPNWITSQRRCPTQSSQSSRTPRTE